MLNQIVNMKKFHGNTFLYFGDKNVSKVSGVWKALHLAIYVAIAVNAFITSMAAGNMFQTFKYNCILYCNEIVFEKETLSLESFGYNKDAFTLTSNEPEQNLSEVSEDMFNDTLSNNTNIQNKNSKTKSKDNSNTESIMSRNETIVYRNQTHVFQNTDEAILIIRAKLDVRKTRFTSNFWCNFVLGVALVTFIFATFCGVMLTMCSKGGRGRENTLNKPQNLIYPLLISSLVLGVLNLAASIIVNNGMRDFCANFELFTENKNCSPMINQFTIHERQARFYLPYVVLTHSFTLTIVMFVCQVLVTLLRIMYAVDYQLYVLEVEDNEEENDFEVEDGHIKERTL